MTQLAFNIKSFDFFICQLCARVKLILFRPFQYCVYCSFRVPNSQKLHNDGEEREREKATQWNVKLCAVFRNQPNTNGVRIIYHIYWCIATTATTVYN